MGRYGYKKGFLKKFLKILLFILFSYACIRLGLAAGNLIYDADIKIVKNTDVEIFKKTLNISIPIIDVTYNSGNSSLSFPNEIRNIISGIFGFDLRNPVTILNAQSSFFLNYYNRQYREFSDGGKESGDDNKYDDMHINDYTKPESEEEKLLEDASSITYEDENEQKDHTGGSLVSSGHLAVQNETKYKIDINGLVKEPLNIKFDRKGPKILIYHTHTTESYLRSLKDLNNNSAANRTRDSRYNVVRVGEELAQILRKKYGIDVIHNGTIHDYPDYNSSYRNSLNTITKILKSYPSIKITLDIHRDALGNGEGKLRTVTSINGKDSARIMFVVGTDQNGLKNPNWRENLKLALKLQEILNEKYPELAKPIDLSKNRYNEHVTNGSLIIEIGGDGNLLGESLESTKYIAEALNEIIRGK